MAVTSMKYVSIVGPMSELDKAADICADSGVFQPEDVGTFYSDTKKFIPLAQKNNYTQTLESFKAALASAGIEPQLAATNGFEPNEQDLKNRAEQIGKELSSMLKRRDGLVQEREKCVKNMEQTKHFVGLGLELDKILACEFVKATFGRLPKESYSKLSEYENNPFVVFFPCTSDNTHYWGVYIAPLEQLPEVDRIFAGLYFERSQINGLSGTPEQYYREQENLLVQIDSELEQINEKFKSYKEINSEEIFTVYSKLEQKNLSFSIKNKAYRYNNNFIMTGWIPSSDEKQFKESLSCLKNVSCETKDGKSELKHSPPVKLKNNFLAKPFEYYTEMYGLPSYNEIDPTLFIAVTYTLLFGIMFADVGHGLMLLLAAIFMCKRKMALGPLLIPCSISSMVFGSVFGSVFGFEHVLDPMFRALGFAQKPIEVMAPDMTNTLIYAAVGLGMVLLVIAMGLGVYSNFRRRNFGEALFGVNGIAGMIFYISVAAGLVCSLLLDISIMSPLYIICLIVIPIILVFLREPLGKLIAGEKQWLPESIGGFLVDNIFEMLEVILSYVTNTMSFLRVGAFILVHAGMMQVVFVLAGMFSGAGYAAVVVIGNIIVMALEALLVGIQVLRLEFYEMFNRFYTGDGRPYIPARLKISRVNK